MLRAGHIHNLWVLKDQVIFKKVARKVNEDQEACDQLAKSTAFSQWHALMLEIRKKKAEEDQRNRFIDILRNSTRGKRSTMEKEEIRRFISQHLSCIPKSINFTEMDTLCNEIDWIPNMGRSILFLQGDFGNCYYMIASGRVGLYLEPSKDREMVVAREFGNDRLQPFQGTDDDLNRLGQNIVNLPQGAGFGEFAILASSNKIRSCAAVALDEDSMLLIMHAETYNTVLRQHHYRQKQLSSATALLQELPLFRHHNYSKVASVAYTMRSQTYSNQSLIIAYGSIINNVMLIASGQVKVYAAPTIEAQGNAKLLQKRIPKLAIALLGRGQIIGEMEVQKGLTTFQLTYESGAAGTEVLEMPVTVFKESITTGGLTQSMMYKNIEDMNITKEQRRVGRMSRAYEAMKSMMNNESKAIQSKDQLVRTLPVLLDPPVESSLQSSGRKTFTGVSCTTATTGAGGTTTSGTGNFSTTTPIVSPRRMSVGTYYGDERPTVPRKASVTLSSKEDGQPHATPTTAAGTTTVTPSTGITFGTSTGSLKFNSPTSTQSKPSRAQSITLQKTPFVSMLSGSGKASSSKVSGVATTTTSTAGATTIGISSPPAGPKPSVPLVSSPRLSFAKHVSI